jgi:hypothetical protein
MRIAGLAVLLACAACAHTQVDVNSSARTSNTVVSGVQVSGGGTLAAALGVAVLTAAALEDERAAPMYRSPGFSDWFWSRPAPEMRPDRPIQEQDCTKPIELSGNLRCR